MIKNNFLKKGHIADIFAKFQRFSRQIWTWQMSGGEVGRSKPTLDWYFIQRGVEIQEQEISVTPAIVTNVAFIKFSQEDVKKICEKNLGRILIRGFMIFSR